MQTRVIPARLSELKLLEKNARYMKGPVFNRLVANIKQDGCLTSLPLVHRRDGDLWVVSGNHRVAAAIKAGIVDTDVIEVTSPLTEKQFIALQLSHNAIVGEDDPGILRSLYEELDFAWKEYSGLSDDAFDINELDISAIQVNSPFYTELTVSFLPGDAEVFGTWLDKIGKAAKEMQRYVGRYEDFDVFFEQLVAVKQARGINNTAVALRLMAELAGAQLEAESQAADAKPARKRA